MRDCFVLCCLCVDVPVCSVLFVVWCYVMFDCLRDVVCDCCDCRDI